MEPDSLRQLRGGVELAADALDAAVGAIAETHQKIRRWVYEPFALLGPLAAPAHAVAQIETAITCAVYQAIRATSGAVAQGALALIDQQADERG